MNAFLHKRRPEPTALDRAIAALDHKSDDNDIRRVLETLFDQGLPPNEHERLADRIRRNTHMNRATFRRYEKIAQARTEGPYIIS